MKIASKPFEQAFKLLSKALEPRQTLPILGHLLVTPGEGEITLAATDLERGVLVHLPAESAPGEPFTLEVKALTKILKALKGAETFEIGPRTARAEATDGRATVNGFPVLSYSGEEFPVVTPPAGEWRPVPGLIPALRLVAEAMSHTEYRGALNGTFLRGSDVVATDGHRLHLARLTDKAAMPPVTLPRKTVGLILLAAKLGLIDQLASRDATGQLRLTEQMLFDPETSKAPAIAGLRAAVALTTGFLVTRLVEGQFPDYQNIMPRDAACKTRIRVQAEALARALTQATAVVTEKTPAVDVVVSQGQVAIHATNSDAGGEVLILVEGATVKGPHLTVGFNARYLLHALAGQSGDVEVALTDPSHPARITAGGLTAVIMPCQTRYQGSRPAEAKAEATEPQAEAEEVVA